MALRNGSPAIDKGGDTLVPIDPSTGLPFTTDQRGFTRVVNGTADIGAFEDQVVVTTPADAQAATPGSVATVALGSFADSAINAGNSSVVVDFGDGSPTMSLLNVVPGSLSSVTHTFTSNGTFTVTVTVTDQFSDSNLGTLAVVSPATPTVSVNLVSITYGTALSNSQLIGTATWTVGGSPVAVAGTFTYTTAAGTVLGAATGQTEAVTFTPTDSIDYTTASTTVIVNVAQAGTTTALSSSINHTVYGQAVSFTATVASAGPAVGPPTGSVTFFAGLDDARRCALSAAGSLPCGHNSYRRLRLDHCSLQQRRQLRGEPLDGARPDRDAGWHHHHGRFVGEPLGLRPIRHLHGHGQPKGGGQWYADWDRHLHRRFDGAGLTNIERRCLSNADHVEPGRFQPQDASGLQQRQQLHRQLDVSPDPDCNEGCYDHHGHVVGEPLGLRPIRHLYGHRLHRST